MLEQDLVTVPGMTYTLSFFLSNPIADTYPIFNIGFGDAFIYLDVNDLNPGSATLTFADLVAAGSHTP